MSFWSWFGSNDSDSTDSTDNVDCEKKSSDPQIGYDDSWLNPTPTEGREGFLTPEQENILEKFRDQMSIKLSELEILSNDENIGIDQDERRGSVLAHECRKHYYLHTPDLLRFLRARKFDIEAATAMMVDAVKWRLEFFNGVDPSTVVGDETILKKYKKNFDVGLGHIHYTTKHETPMPCFIVEPYRHVKCKNSQEVEDIIKIMVLIIEAGLRLAKPPVEAFVVILDLHDFSLSCVDFSLVSAAVKVIQDCYPERLGVCYILNAPFFFWWLWRIVRPWLDDVVAAKVVFLKNNDMAETLLRVFDKKHLQIRHGGTSEFKYLERKPHQELGIWEGAVDDIEFDGGGGGEGKGKREEKQYQYQEDQDQVRLSIPSLRPFECQLCLEEIEIGSGTSKDVEN